MGSSLRDCVRDRARYRCEYCQLHEDDSDYLSFHVDHVIARQHGGTDDPEYLCFAFPECNWAKGPNLTGLFEGKLYPLFNPRKQSLSRHFYWDQTILVGKTMSGRVTVQVLNINETSLFMLSENLLFEGRFPPL